MKIKAYASYLARTTRFWNCLHQVQSKLKYLKSNNMFAFLLLFIEKNFTELKDTEDNSSVYCRNE